jgi:hypothetical protein
MHTELWQTWSWSSVVCVCACVPTAVCLIRRANRAEGYRAVVSLVPAHQLTRRHVQITATFISTNNCTVTATRREVKKASSDCTSMLWTSPVRGLQITRRRTCLWKRSGLNRFNVYAEISLRLILEPRRISEWKECLGLQGDVADETTSYVWYDAASPIVRCRGVIFQKKDYPALLEVQTKALRATCLAHLVLRVVNIQRKSFICILFTFLGLSLCRRNKMKP